MATVHIPALLRDLTGGAERVEVEMAAGETLTVREVVARIEAMHPGMELRLLEEDDLAAGLAVFIDGEQAGLKLNAKVRPEDEVFFLPPIAGG